MKNIVCFDVETTGLSQKEDFIIQLSMIKITPQFEEIERKSWYIKPVHNYEIKTTAIEKHGITKEFLEKNGVNLKDIAQEIIDFIEGCDFLTYNGNSFDIGFLYKDLKIVGYNLNMEGRTCFDAFLLYKMMYPSTLEAVYKRCTGKNLEGAHNAINDVEATIEVYKALRNENIEVDESVFNIVSPEGSIRKVIIDDVESLVFSFGKYKDDEFFSVYKKDPQYVKWFLANIASDYTFNILKKYCQERKNKK